MDMDMTMVVQVPMLNPDGVFLGNYRCNSLGLDLNRLWHTPVETVAPTIHRVRDMLLFYSKHPMCRLNLFVDVHTHSTCMNGFVFVSVLLVFCVCTRGCMHMHTSTCVHARLHAHAHEHVCAREVACTCTRARVCTRGCMHMHTSMCCVHMTNGMCMCMCTLCPYSLLKANVPEDPRDLDAVAAFPRALANHSPT